MRTRQLFYRAFPRLFGLTAGLVAVSVAGLVAVALGLLPATAAWLATVLSGLAAGLTCWRLAAEIRPAPGRRQFWYSTGSAITLVSLGSALHLYQSVRAATELAPSNVTRWLNVLGAAVMVVGLLRLPRRPVTAPAVRRVSLDAAIVLTTAGVFAWHLSFGEAVRVLPGGGWKMFAGMMVMSAVAAVGFVKVTLVDDAAVSPAAVQRAAWGIGLGVGLGLVAPLTVAALHIRPVVLALPATALGYALAARRQRRARDGEQAARPSGPAFSLMPYLSAAATTGLLLVVAWRGDHRSLLPVAAGTTALIGLVLYRQFNAVHANDLLLRQVDVSTRQLRQMHRQLDHQRRHDRLTGLIDRREFEEELEQRAAAGQTGTLALINVDNFKAVNDHVGRPLGDQLLLLVAHQVCASVRASDLVARFDGDEFAVLLRDLSVADAAGVLDRIDQTVRQPVDITGHDLVLTVSVGTTETRTGADAGELLHRANLALYAAKSGGKGRRVHYSESLEERVNNDVQLGAELRRALNEAQFTLVYQPVVRLPDGRIAGAEALIRWAHPTRGAVPPDEFIPAAERTGLIVPIGDWVLVQACSQAAGWLRYSGAQPWRVSVNVSARQLIEAGFAARVAEILDGTGLPADRLTIEVTETAVFDNQVAAAALRRIADLGVAVALDDFGTGHSSLALLRAVPVDILKVDKLFIDHVADSDADATIATAALYIAQGLNLGVVAEGVETTAQADRLHELGFPAAQGYHFARPVSGADILRQLRALANR
ncbi:hypothetical protein GCM10010124_36320 [Pilimelia terevasa]|uniref:Diguanylate cyclase/phosphodiesterase n=1 Tax=Pilimelia terevasa TaxID=53372 RepID=A0A8J3FLY2_9ACTN|nr:bifunctional diguanylate cyclase/phosphodiesterase [Pilimelia terevasa]GGK40331.1 hypothetical protein GCM10010124_36320 [Pilimelia terevasa]